MQLDYNTMQTTCLYSFCNTPAQSPFYPGYLANALRVVIAHLDKVVEI